MWGEDGHHAMSLPGSRRASPRASPTPIDGENIEVVANSYDLSSLLAPSDEDDGEAGGTMEITAKSEGTTQPGALPLSSCSSMAQDEQQELTSQNSLVTDVSPKVKVMGLGFITNMAEYMVGTDVLVSKAGPGTIAEAASLSLPVMLTSFLPGQEEGNVDYVVEGNFGTFVSDSDPQGISDVVASWLMNEDKLKELSENAHKCGKPDAAAEIVDAIGRSALEWKRHHHSRHGSEVKEIPTDGTLPFTPPPPPKHWTDKF